ncbi:MAG TPA: HAD family hydrolase [Polyangiaceae bacterium]|jgi:phosphoglycolate phosphatase|nr:HAD family hydrolase [Polyangiaceae bacterium]
MPRPTIALFDIDGTLIVTGGTGRRSVNRAFGKLHGRSDACDSFGFDGMTDRLIARTGLEAIGVEASPEAIDAWLAEYLLALADEVARADGARFRLLPGMSEAISACLEAGMAVGLGTGNVREGARIKLERVGVHHHFRFGGFGCDAEARPEVIRLGAERGARALGVPLAECRVVVIGDTPRDVHAADSIGAECIAVATGSYSVEQLRASGARHTFADFSEPVALSALLAD